MSPGYNIYFENVNLPCSCEHEDFSFVLGECYYSLGVLYLIICISKEEMIDVHKII